MIENRDQGTHLKVENGASPRVTVSSRDICEYGLIVQK